MKIFIFICVFIYSRLFSCEETSVLVPNIFLSINETQTLMFHDFLPGYYPDLKVGNITNQFYDIKMSETLETIEDYSFQSSPHLKKSKFVPELNCLFLFFTEKNTIFFIEPKMDRFIEIKNNIKLNYSSEFAEASNITCYDLVYLNQTGEIIFDCDIYYANDTKPHTGFIFYTIDAQYNRQFKKVKHLIFNDTDPSRLGIPYLSCVRLLQLKNDKIYRRCSQDELLQNNSVSSYYMEIYNLTYDTQGGSLVYFDYRLDTRIIFTGNMTINTLFGLNNFRVFLVASNTLFSIQLYETPVLGKLFKVLESKTYSKEVIVTLYLFGDRDANVSLSILLTKQSFYLVTNTYPMQVTLLANLGEVSPPVKFHYTQGYFLIEFNKFIKFYQFVQNGTNVTILNSFYHFFPAPQFIFYYINILFIGPLEAVSILSKKTSYYHGENETNWNFNISQILYRKVQLRYNQNFLTNATTRLNSMDMSNVSIIVNNEYTATITIYYWNLEDPKAYFFINSPGDNNNLLISEEVNINLEDYVVGPLTKATLIKTSPIKEAISVADSQSFTLDSTNLIKLGFNPKNIRGSTIYLQIEANSHYFSIIWQNNKNMALTMIRCYEIKDSLITDCIQIVKYDTQSKKILKIERFKNTLWILDESKKLHVLVEQTQSATIAPLDNSPACEDIIISEASNVILCINHNRLYLDAYIIVNNTITMTLMKGDVFGVPGLTIDKLYVDLFDFDSIIVKSGSYLYFFEIVPNYKGDLYYLSRMAKPFSFFLKNKKQMKSNNFDVYIINKPQIRKMIIVDYNFNTIEEYSMEYPTNIFFSRNYPVFGYKIETSILNSHRYLGIVASRPFDMGWEYNFHNQFMLFYDTEQQSGNLLKRKVDLEYDRWKVNIKLLDDNMIFRDSGKIYAALFILNYDTISIKTIENMKLTGTLKNIYRFPDFMNKQFLTFSFRLYFYTIFSREKIFYVLNITLIPKDTVITSPFLDTNEFLQMQSQYREIVFKSIEKYENNRYSYIVPDNVFKGPINNYMYSNEASSASDDQIDIRFSETNSRFNAYLTPTLHFEEYHVKNTNFGDIVSMDLHENILVILSKRLLTFYDINLDYKIVYQFNIPGNKDCLSVEHHAQKDLLVIFCKMQESFSTPVLVIQVFQYEYTLLNKLDNNTNLDNNKSKDNNSDNSNENFLLNNSKNNDTIFRDENGGDHFSYKNADISFNIEKMMFINGDSELMDNNFVSSQSLGDHLFILAKEFYSFTNSIYIFQLPSDENDDNLVCKGQIQMSYEYNMNHNYNVRSENFTIINTQAKIIDFQVYQSNKTGANDSAVIFGLLTLNENEGNFVEFKVNKSANEECSIVVLEKRIHINFKELISFDEITLSSIKFYSLSLISVEESLNNNQNITKIVFLLTTNIEILELELTIINVTLQLKVLYSYRKYFSCNFVASSPLKFNDFLGSFCEKESSEIKNYFLLYKRVVGQNESHPIRTLPLLIDRFELLFYSNNGNYFLILPSYLNLYQEYSIDQNLTLLKSKKRIMQEQNFVLTAYNDLSNASCIIKLINEDDQDPGYGFFWIILLSVLGLIAVVFGYLFFIWLRNVRKEKMVFNEEMIGLEHVKFHRKNNRDGSINSTMVSSISTFNKELNKESLIGEKQEIKKKEPNPKSERYSCEMQIQKKIRDFNKNF